MLADTSRLVRLVQPRRKQSALACQEEGVNGAAAAEDSAAGAAVVLPVHEAELRVALVA